LRESENGRISEEPLRKHIAENLRREIDSSRTSEGLASQQRCYAGGFLVICDGEEEGEMIAARPA
jgi:hypothetical protein